MDFFIILTNEFFNKYLLVTNILCMPFCFYIMEQGCGLRYSRSAAWSTGILVAIMRHFVGQTIVDELTSHYSAEPWFLAACSAIYIIQFIMLFVYFRVFYLGELVKLFLLETITELILLIRYYFFQLEDLIFFDGRKTVLSYQKGYGAGTLVTFVLLFVLVYFSKPLLKRYRDWIPRYRRFWTAIVVFYFILGLFSQYYYLMINGDFYELLLFLIPFTAIAVFLLLLYLGEYYQILNINRQRMEAESRSLERHYMQVVDQTGQIRAVNLDMQRTIERLMERLVDEASKRQEDVSASETAQNRSNDEVPDTALEREARLMAAHDYLHELRKQYEKLNEAKYCEDYEINTLLVLNENKYKNASLQTDFFFQGQTYDLGQNKEDLLSLMNILLDYGYRLLTEEGFSKPGYKNEYEAAAGNCSSPIMSTDMGTPPSCSFRVAQVEERFVLSLKAEKKGLSCRKTWKGLPGMYKKDRLQLDRILRRYRGDLTAFSPKDCFQIIIVINKR